MLRYYFYRQNKAVLPFQKAVRFVELLGEVRVLQHGICFMIWDTFLRQPFRYMYDFLNRKSSKFKKLEDCRMDLASVCLWKFFNSKKF